MKQLCDLTRVGAKLLSTSVLISVLAGCTFVKLSPAGAAVDVRANSAVIDCTKLGSVTVNGLDKVGFIQRKDGRVSGELATQARNDAAEMGANVVVPVAQPVDGRQKFAAYRCP